MGAFLTLKILLLRFEFFSIEGLKDYVAMDIIEENFNIITAVLAACISGNPNSTISMIVGPLLGQRNLKIVTIVSYTMLFYSMLLVVDFIGPIVIQYFNAGDFRDLVD